MKYKYCPRCGHKCLQSDRFCTYCRYDFNKRYQDNIVKSKPERTQHQKVNIVTANDINKPRREEHHHMSSGAISTLVVIGTIFVIFMLILVISVSGSSNSYNTSNTNNSPETTKETKSQEQQQQKQQQQQAHENFMKSLQQNQDELHQSGVDTNLGI